MSATNRISDAETRAQELLDCLEQEQCEIVDFPDENENWFVRDVVQIVQKGSPSAEFWTDYPAANCSNSWLFASGITFEPTLSVSEQRFFLVYQSPIHFGDSTPYSTALYTRMCEIERPQ